MKNNKKPKLKDKNKGSVRVGAMLLTFYQKVDTALASDERN